MEALVGPFAVASVLLAVGGGFKIVRPAPTAGALSGVGLPIPLVLVRALGVGEVALGAGALVSGVPALAALVGVAYLAFAGFVVVAIHAGGAVSSCGCFGEVETPPSAAHVVLNTALAAVALTTAATSAPSLAGTLSRQPAAGVPFLALVGLGVYLCYLVLTALPQALAAAR